MNKRNCYLATAYIINRQGMQNVLKRCRFDTGQIVFEKEPRASADVYIFATAGTTYHCKPMTVFAVNDDANVTTEIQSRSDLINQQTNALAVIQTFL